MTRQLQVLDLTDEQVVVISAIWSAYVRNQEWPIAEYVDDRLEREGLRLERLLSTFPGYRSVPYGPVWWQTNGPPRPDTKVGVTIAGLYHLPRARGLVETFVEVVRLAALEWRNVPSKPNQPRQLVLRFGDLVRLIRTAEPEADLRLVRVIQALLEHEPPTWRGLSAGPDEAWRWEVAATIRGFDEVGGALDYLLKLDDLIDEVPVTTDPFVLIPNARKAAISSPLRGADPGLWPRINAAVEAGLWDQVVREATVFLEDHLRRWAGLTTNHHGVDLVTAALRPSSGTMPLGRSGNQAEQEGWHLLARGLFLAVRNASGHRLDAFSDEQRALGIVGTVSLLIAQIKLEHPVPVDGGE